MRPPSSCVIFCGIILLLLLGLPNLLGSFSKQESEFTDDPLPLQTHRRYLPLNETDYILSHPGWDSSPIVIESHKLIFFTIKKNGCTTWKRLFRRTMVYDDWQSIDISPHNPETNGLKYLRQYPLDQAESMINDPTYTKAIFVRDPKERFLSAFLEKALGPNGTHILNVCHSRPRDRIWKKTRTFEGFVRLTRRECHDDHWRAQSLRLDPTDPTSRLWQSINFVGHMERIQEDSKRLLQQIGAWETYGGTGWDRDGRNAIFETTESVSHKSGAAKRLSQYYTPQLVREIDRRYAIEYQNPVLGLVQTIINFSASA